VNCPSHSTLLVYPDQEKLVKNMLMNFYLLQKLRYYFLWYDILIRVVVELTMVTSDK